jgi:hypothetical protein
VKKEAVEGMSTPNVADQYAVREKSPANQRFLAVYSVRNGAYSRRRPVSVGVDLHVGSRAVVSP